MRTVTLIPTDLTIESLMLVKHALIKSQNQEMKIILLYCSRLPDSISDLLFYSPSRELNKVINKDFMEACNVLQNKYEGRVKSIHIKIFHGEVQAVFDSFVRAENISETYIPLSYIMKKRRGAFDPLPFIRNSGLRIYEVDWEAKRALPEKDTLAELFSQVNMESNTVTDKIISYK